MGDIVASLRYQHELCPAPHLPSAYSQAADEIERLQNAWASAVSRAVRAEDDADRLAGVMGDPDQYGEVLDLHHKEVEAR